MKLSKFERQSLINQYEIMRRLDGKPNLDYDKYIDILQSGYEVDYEDVVTVEDDIPERVGINTIKILNVYDGLAFEYLKNPDEYTEEDLHKIKFMGFDEHSEIQYLGYARFLIGNGHYDKLFELSGERDSRFGFNSHGLGNNIASYLEICTKYDAMVHSRMQTAEGIRPEDVMSIFE